MSKKKSLTELEKEYRKQRRRIQQFIRRATKRGYIIPETALPKQPKKVTKKSVERLQKITPSTIYQKSKYQPDKTVAAISATEGRKVERKQASRKAVETKRARQSLSVFRDTQEKSAYEIAQEKALQKIHDYQKSTEEKQGFLFPKQVLAEWEEMIKTGGLSYEELIDIAGDKLLESNIAKYKDPRTGTVFTGKEGLEIEKYRKEVANRHEKIESGAINETDYVLKEVERLIADWSPSLHWNEYMAELKQNDKNLLQKVLEGAIENEGRDAVARRMQEHADEIEDLAEKILRSSGGKGQDGRNEISGAIMRFRNIIYGSIASKEEADKLNEWVEASEIDGVFE